jgi:uncharacterized membrane protein YqhA
MKEILIIAVFAFLLVLAVFFARKLMESIVNLWIALRHKNKPPYHEGMVLNKKTGKLEADNSKILPFK